VTVEELLAALPSPPGGLTVRQVFERGVRAGWAARDADQVVNRDRVSRVVTPEAQETLAVALEEAAQRVRQSQPAGFEVDVEDDVDVIHVGPGQTIPGMRSPLRRVFRVEW
jgi:hypothetical protein